MVGVGDELENEWDVDLFTVDLGRRATRIYDDKFDNLARLPDRINELFKPFVWFQFQLNGTTANIMAMTMATDSQMNRCLIASGSYVGGDQTCAQPLSTSYLQPGAYFCDIIVDGDHISNAARSQTIPLPYHVPSDDLDNNALQEMEDECIHHLHVRYFASKIDGKAFKAIFLELILAGNGGSLSDCFLEKLGNFCLEYGISIVVDEIMTSVRCGPTLLSLEAPSTFQQAIAFITVGKWAKIGIVLMNPGHETIINLLEERNSVKSQNRGFSVDPKMYETFQMITQVKSYLGVARERGEMVTNWLRNADKNVEYWGKGCLIFSNRPRKILIVA